MNIRKEFLMYKDRVAEAGYELVCQNSNERDTLLYVRLHNNIKVEIRYKKYKGKFMPIILAAWKHKQLDLIREYFDNNDYELPEKTHNIKSCINTKFLTIDNFIDVCEKLEDVDGLVATTRGRGIDRENFFINVAKHIKLTVDMKSTGLLNREMFDKVDSLISINKPLSENSYREHVVPCTMILNNAIDMFEDNRMEEDVAQMIEDNLKIVHITKDQAKHLDIDLGLRTSMPSGWAFGDNIFARLDEAGINY